MSRDVISVDEYAPAERARQLLLDHNIRTLPVVDKDARLVGTVGLRELARADETVASVTSTPSTAAAGSPAMALLPVLTDGRTHAVIVVDDDSRILGLITQTDLLAATARAQTADKPSAEAVL